MEDYPGGEQIDGLSCLNSQFQPCHFCPLNSTGVTHKCVLNFFLVLNECLETINSSCLCFVDETAAERGNGWLKATHNTEWNATQTQAVRLTGKPLVLFSERPAVSLYPVPGKAAFLGDFCLENTTMKTFWIYSLRIGCSQLAGCSKTLLNTEIIEKCLQTKKGQKVWAELKLRFN